VEVPGLIEPAERKKRPKEKAQLKGKNVLRKFQDFWKRPSDEDSQG